MHECAAPSDGLQTRPYCETGRYSSTRQYSRSYCRTLSAAPCLYVGSSSKVSAKGPDASSTASLQRPNIQVHLLRRLVRLRVLISRDAAAVRCNVLCGGSRPPESSDVRARATARRRARPPADGEGSQRGPT